MKTQSLLFSSALFLALSCSSAYAINLAEPEIIEDPLTICLADLEETEVKLNECKEKFSEEHFKLATCQETSASLETELAACSTDLAEKNEQIATLQTAVATQEQANEECSNTVTSLEAALTAQADSCISKDQLTDIEPFLKKVRRFIRKGNERRAKQWIRTAIKTYRANNDALAQ